jgi:hypothetical protein
MEQLINGIDIDLALFQASSIHYCVTDYCVTPYSGATAYNTYNTDN